MRKTLIAVKQVLFVKETLNFPDLRENFNQ